MSYPKLLQRLVERKRPVTVHLSCEAFEREVTRHLASADATLRTKAVLHLRLSSYDSIRSLVGVAAARLLLCSTGSTLLRTANTVATAYLGDGVFAVLMSGMQPSDAELHAGFLVYAIADMRLQWGDMTLCSDAFAGLVIADKRRDGKALLAEAEQAGLAAREQGGGRGGVVCVDEVATSEAEERLIPSCLIADVSLDDMGPAAVSLVSLN